MSNDSEHYTTTPGEVCYCCKVTFRAMVQDFFTTISKTFAMVDTPLCPSCQRLMVVSGLAMLREIETRIHGGKK